MKTPITESYATHVDRWDSKRGSYQPAGIMVDANVSRRLELDRAALMEALEELIGDMGAFRRDLGVAFSLKKASAALSAARANFPEQ